MADNRPTSQAEREVAREGGPAHAGKGAQARGLFGGRVTLRQLPRGHRAGTDAVLLAAAAPLEGVGHVVDLGAGVGAAGLVLAGRSDTLRVVLVERDPEAAALARANVAENGFSARVTVEERDALAAGHAGPADLVVTNPPWHPQGNARVALDKRGAHVMPPGGLESWVKAALGLLAPRGRILLIHRADSLATVLQALDRRFGGLAVRPVQPREGAPAARILVLGTKGSRSPLRLLPPIVLHQADGSFTPFAAALHAGEVTLDWT
jgi:tRNA1(Val) A37 N6-methylase TrmN6